MIQVRTLVFAVGALVAACAVAGVAYVDGESFYGPFVLTHDNASEAPYRTEVCFGMTPQTFAFEFRCQSRNVTQVIKEAKGPMFWDCAEGCELLLDTSGRGKSRFHLAVGANGHVWDERARKRKENVTDWNADVRPTNGGYIVTGRVPWSVLGLDGCPKIGTKWRFNAGRNLSMPDGSFGYSSYAHTGISYDNAAKYEELFFGSRAEVEKALTEERHARSAVLRREIAQAGLSGTFAVRFKAFDAGAPESVLDEIRDEFEVERRVSDFRKAKK